MEVLCSEGLASHTGPEPCVGPREGTGEASAGERAGRPSSRERATVPGADVVTVTEGNTDEGVSASPRTVRRGPRPWHVRTLLDREPGDRVSRTQARRVCGAVWKMKDRPFEVGFREQASNHPKRHRSKAVVVSVGGKGR